MAGTMSRFLKSHRDVLETLCDAGKQLTWLAELMSLVIATQGVVFARSGRRAGTFSRATSALKEEQNI